MIAKRNITRKQVLQTIGLLLFKVFRFILLLGVSYIMLYPVMRLMTQAFSIPSDLYDNRVEWLPKTPTFSNFIVSVRMFGYWPKFKNTLLICIPSTVLQIIVCSCVGYGLAKYRSKWSKLVFAMVIVSIVFPMQSYNLPLYTQYRFFDYFGIGKLIGLFSGTTVTTNLLNSYWVFYLPAMFGVGINSGLYIFIFRQFFMGMPIELEEASRVDGCNALATYIRIVVPNAVPVIVTVVILSMVSYWNDTAVTGMFLSAPEKFSLVNYLGTLGSNQGSVIEMEVRLSTILLLVQGPLMLVYIVGQKFFTECMDRSGIKG